jgi:hypothetical protein
VEVIPSTGAARVDAGGGERGISYGCEVRVAGIIEVIINGAWEGVAARRISAPQPVLKKVSATKITIDIRIGTPGLYRLSHKLPDSSGHLKTTIELVI